MAPPQPHHHWQQQQQQQQRLLQIRLHQSSLHRLGVGAKPSSLFANLTSPTVTATPATTTNAQLGGGLLFGTVPTTATNTGSVGTTTSMAPFSFGTPTSSSQPSGSLFGLATVQPAVSATPTIGASTSSLFGQKSTSGGLFGQVAATTPSTIPTTGSLFSTSTIGSLLKFTF
ncbi:unnamed protein product [Brugia timori]|uniref:Uncharacterized protein n=1 Tax=Brugia timori TaxID=42155 RepID=A0A3P7TYS1_9BILA|nr:unnamed protein product [Brugia timori]